MHKLYHLATLALLSLLPLSLVAQDDQAKNNEALSLRTAQYEFELGNYSAARTTLLKQIDVKENYQHLLLLAQVLVEEENYQQAQEVFAKVDLDEVPDVIRNKSLVSLAHLYYAQSLCDEAIEVLKNTKKLANEQEAFSRFLHSGCLMKQEQSVKQLETAEKLVETGVRKGVNQDSQLWFSYAYYNLAIAAANMDALEKADRLFEQALLFTGHDSEGKALAQKIRVTQANIRYLDNRFDYAMASYEALPINSYWQDEALLGYGWAAFKNYQTERAIEAWWQLTNLPFKSINVYQAYLLIPFAYERANAFNQALSGYDKAIDQYDNIITELEQFKQRLSVERIHQHAVHYYLNPEDIQPIHPLLTITYTKPDFRQAVEQIGKLTSYQERLTQYQHFLELQEVYRKQFEAEADTRANWRQQQASSVSKRFAQLNQDLDDWVDELIKQELNRDNAPVALLDLNRRYQSIKKQWQTNGAPSQLKPPIARLQGVVFQKVVEQSTNKGLLEKIHEVSLKRQTLRVRFVEYRQLTRQHFEQEVDDRDIERLQQDIASQLQVVNGILTQVLNSLLEKTELALQEQQETIAHYERQARVARANLREEFYQRGGSKLWY